MLHILAAYIYVLAHVQLMISFLIAITVEVFEAI